jgi:DNA-binding MarR family transcriptional regulator
VSASSDPTVFQFFNEIGIIEQLSHTLLQRSLPDGLKVSQFSVLNHLVRLEGEWSPVRLAKAFQVTKGAMTNNLQRLEKRGLVEVIDNPADGRGKLIKITQAGRDMRDRCVASIGPLMAKLSDEISNADFEAALPFLEKVRQYLDSHRI